LADKESVLWADEVWLKGRIYTVDASFSVVSALAWKDGIIVYVGDDEGAGAFIGKNTVVEDMSGKTVFPGFIDTHLHLEMYGDSLLKLRLKGCSKAAILDLVAETAKKTPPGEWILGGLGWNNEDWEESAYPSLQELDRAAPKHPVLLPRIDGHMVWFNSLALEMAGISANVANPPGGEFLRKSDGQLLGCATDVAADMVRDRIPPPDKAYKTKALLAAQEKLLAYGVTGIQDAYTSPELAERLKELYTDTLFKLRFSGALVNAVGPDADPAVVPYLDSCPQTGLCGGFFTVRTVKLFADGSLGAQSAALMEAYNDRPGYRGMLMHNDDDFYAMVREAAGRDMQVMVHAIGDAAIEQTLSVFERVEPEFSLENRRFRIEHFQLVRDNFCSRAKNLGVIAAMQGSHGPNSASMAEHRLGMQRAANSYAIGKVQRALGMVAGGSDAPVAEPNPLLGIHASVTRTNSALQPRGGFFPENALTREAAIRSYTSWAAYALFAEQERGAIEKGKKADVTVLDGDIMILPADEILQVRVLRTVIDGKTVYPHDS
jgi:predicted amidohydrolase YtcJ